MVKPAYLTAKFQIGSCKGPVGYAPSETVFHPDDIPKAKKANTTAVRAWKKDASRVLGTKSAKGAWNTSVYINPPPPPRMRSCHEHDRPHMLQYNYRAEVLPPKQLEHVPKPHKFKVTTVDPARVETIRLLKAENSVLAGKAKCIEEMPVHPKLAGKTLWNGSSGVSKADTREKFAKMTKQCAANSKKATGGLATYVSPETREKLRRAEMRRMKESGNVPAVDADAAATSRLPTHNRLAKEPSVRYRTFAHSGAWEYRAAEYDDSSDDDDDLGAAAPAARRESPAAEAAAAQPADGGEGGGAGDGGDGEGEGGAAEERPKRGTWMWSDTGSFERDTPGDIVRIRNPAAFNF